MLTVIGAISDDVIHGLLGAGGSAILVPMKSLVGFLSCQLYLSLRDRIRQLSCRASIELTIESKSLEADIRSFSCAHRRFRDRSGRQYASTNKSPVKRRIRSTGNRWQPFEFACRRDHKQQRGLK